MNLIKPTISQHATYSQLEKEFFSHHKPYKTLFQDVPPQKRDLKKEFTTMCRERNSFFRFVVVEKKVIGYVYATIEKVSPNEKGWTHIIDLNSLIITKKYRNKGYAKQIIEKVFSFAKQNNIHYVKASCNVLNLGVQKLNESMGFSPQFITYGKIIR